MVFMHKAAQPLTSTQPADAFCQLWLSETLRLHEQHNPPLEDSEACRQARQQGGDLRQRLTSRNLWLARREGLLDSLQAWLSAARLTSFALAITALLLGLGLGQAALSRQQDSINIIWALVSLLGPNLLALAFWLVSLFAGSSQPSQFTRLLLSASERLSRSPKASQLTVALFSLLGRARLLPWALGRWLHTWWLLVMLAALASSLFLLATHRYSFAWETTIVHSDSFVLLIQTLGQPAHWLGLPLPDAELIRSSGESLQNSATARQSWAGWLIGMLLIYGLVPRLLLALFCQWRWRRGRQQLQLDPQDPAWLGLHTKLMPTPSSQVIDPAPVQQPSPAAVKQHSDSPFTAIASLELDQPPLWQQPPPACLNWLGNLDGYQDQQALLEQLAGQPHSLILACDSRRSPDRGSLHFIAELARSCSRLHIWLLNAEQDSQRLAGWQQTLDALGIAHSSQSPWQHSTEASHD